MKATRKSRAKKSPGANKAKEIVQPVREVIQMLLNEKRVNSEKLAKAMGKARSTVKNTKYLGFGGFDTMVAALLISYGLENISKEKLYDGMKKCISDLGQEDEADIEWRRADRYYTKKEKRGWARIMNLYGELSRGSSGKKRERTYSLSSINEILSKIEK